MVACQILVVPSIVLPCQLNQMLTNDECNSSIVKNEMFAVLVL